MDEDTRSYSTHEIAQRLGVSLQTVQRWVDSGRVKAWKTPGGHRRIDARSAELLFDQQKQGVGAAADAKAAPPAKAIRLVIVDDDPLDRELMATLAQEALPDAEIRVAGNGFQGLVMIAKFAPEILVTDVHMPHMDGFEMIRNVLADAETRPRLLIAVSAKSAQELAGFGLLPADVLLLQKPLRRDDFTGALQRPR